MARVMCVVVLLTLTILQLVNADATSCKDEELYDTCDDYLHGFCVCANDNDATYYNSGDGSPCGGNENYVCKDISCFVNSGKFIEPKKSKGGYLTCSEDSECGGNYECFYGYCCLKRLGVFKNYGPDTW